MEALLDQLASEEKARRREFFIKYLDILRRGDAGAATSLGDVMRELGFTRAQVVEHAAIVKELPALMRTTERFEEIKKNTQLYPVEARAATEDMARLRVLRMNHPYLFRDGVGNLEPTPSPVGSTAFVHRDVIPDAQLLELDPDEVYSRSELIEKFGLTSSIAIEASLPGISGTAADPMHLGITIISWARECFRISRELTRRKLQEHADIYIGPKLLRLEDRTTYTGAELLSMGLTSSDLTKIRLDTFGNYRGDNVAGYARNRLADKRSAIAELTRMANEDGIPVPTFANPFPDSPGSMQGDDFTDGSAGRTAPPPRLATTPGAALPRRPDYSERFKNHPTAGRDRADGVPQTKH